LKSTAEKFLPSGVVRDGTPFHLPLSERVTRAIQ